MTVIFTNQTTQFMKNTFLLLAISATLWSCDRCNGIDCVNLPSFQFKLIRQGKNVTGSYQQARLFGAGNVESPLRFTLKSDSSSCFTASVPVGADRNILYLVLSGADTDTISVDTRTVTENCCTGVQLTSLRFNGQETINLVDADYCHLFVKR